MTALHPISIAKYFTLKPSLWRSMQRWAYLWHLWFTLFSKGTVSSSIEIHSLILSITTRCGLSLITRWSGEIVHGFSPRSTLIIRSLSLTWFTNSVILLSVLSWHNVYLPWTSINVQPESTWAMVFQSPQRSHASEIILPHLRRLSLVGRHWDRCVTLILNTEESYTINEFWCTY